jgi:hydroxyacylglutathione hydrolase
MSIHIQLIKNKPVDSNCYVISHDSHRHCIIIDPGEKKGEQLFIYLNEHELTPDFIILTHEHFDHIWGVNNLKDKYDVQLICSQYCSEKIITPKGNLSVFYDQVGFKTNPADLTVEELGYKLTWKDCLIKFIPTPGHTGGCICIEVDNNLFTGDFIIKGIRTSTKFPGGDTAKLNTSLAKVILSCQGKNIKVFPGHGDPFYFDEIIFTPEFAIH